VKVRLPPSVSLPTRLEIKGPAELEPDGKTLKLTRPGAVQIEVWALGPGRFLEGEWKPWLVPSPIWVYAGEGERTEP
jgi:hypothetical protein